jgi:Trypsin-like peptidase domain
MISAAASQTEPESPWIVVAKITRNEQDSATGIYLKPGLVITAAHLTANWTGDAALSVHIAGTALPANLVKQGEVEEVDLALFSVDEQKLPERIARIQTPLCQAPPWPGDPVIVIDNHKGATRSHIVSPRILPFTSRTKFRTLIGDVASTGDSGSGVFDPNRRCLLGIMSRKYTANGKDIAKYFVPASEIRDFIPLDSRERVLIK